MSAAGRTASRVMTRPPPAERTKTAGTGEQADSSNAESGDRSSLRLMRARCDRGKHA